MTQLYLVKEAAQFLRSHEPLLLKVYLEALKNCPDTFFGRLSLPDMHGFAVTNVSGIIHRFEGVQISLERTEQNLFPLFEQGVSPRDFNFIMNATTEAMKDEFKRILVDQPQLLEYLIQKIDYLRQAYGSMVALAMSKFHNP